MAIAGVLAGAGLWNLPLFYAYQLSSASITTCVQGEGKTKDVFAEEGKHDDLCHRGGQA